MYKTRKRKTSKTTPIKKVGRGFSGICELRQLSINTYFRTVDKNGKVAKKPSPKACMTAPKRSLNVQNIRIFWEMGAL